MTWRGGTPQPYALALALSLDFPHAGHACLWPAAEKKQRRWLVVGGSQGKEFVLGAFCGHVLILVCFALFG